MAEDSRFRSTTIVAVRRDGRAALAGDGQVSLGQTVLKDKARKVRRIADGKVIVGFAGATADAFALLERLELGRVLLCDVPHLVCTLGKTRAQGIRSL